MPQLCHWGAGKAYSPAVLQRPLGWHFCHTKLILFNLLFHYGILTKKSLKTCSEKYIFLEQCITQISFAFSYQILVHSSSLLKIHEETSASETAGCLFQGSEEERAGKRKGNLDSMRAQSPSLNKQPKRGPFLILHLQPHPGNSISEIINQKLLQMKCHDVEKGIT